jgi:hypothetical protein
MRSECMDVHIHFSTNVGASVPGDRPDAELRRFFLFFFRAAAHAR